MGQSVIHIEELLLSHNYSRTSTCQNQQGEFGQEQEALRQGMCQHQQGIERQEENCRAPCQHWQGYVGSSFKSSS